MTNTQVRRAVTARLWLINGAIPLISLLYVLAFSAAQARGIPLFDCVFHRLFGIYCPGCGGSRSVRCLLRLEFWRSFLYYPAIPYTAGLLLWYDVRLISALRRKSETCPHIAQSAILVIPTLILVTFAVRLVATLVFGVDLVAWIDAMG